MGKLTLKAGAHEVTEDITGKNLLSVITNILPKNKLPDGFDYNSLIVVINGEQIDLSTFDINKEFDCDVVINSPAQGLTAIAIGTVAASLAVSVAASYLLAPKYNQADSGATDSPNNSFFGQTNLIRLNEQFPNLYGKNISYPDSLVGEGGVWEYEDNIKKVWQLFAIGSGHYDKEPPKYELTELESITGSEYEFYDPFDIVPVVKGQFNSEFIDGQTLLGPNNDETSGKLVASEEEPEMFVYEEVGYVYIIVPITEDWTAINDAVEQGSGNPITFRYRTVGTIEIVATGNITSMSIDSTGFYGIDILSGDAKYRPTEEYIDLTLTLLPPESQVEVTLPVKSGEVQMSFDFLRGLRGSVSISAYIRTENGEERFDYTYEANTSNQLYFTEKEQIDPPISSDLRVRLVRFSDDKEDGTDTIQVSQVATNTYRYDASYGNLTLLETNRKATRAALKTAASKINVECTRRTISYDIESGEIIRDLNASRSFADAILHEYVEMMGLSPSDLPLDEMYELYGSIPNGMGYFDSTFADKEQSIKSKLDIIANVARCEFPFDGSRYRIIRDEARAPSIQFDSRNIDSSSDEEVSYRGATATSNNGVMLQWKNLDDNKFEYVYFVIDGASSVQCIDQGGGNYIPDIPTIPYEVDLVGCSTIEQAINRCDYECRKLIYIQKTVRTTVLKDGENVQRGDVVKHVDYYDTEFISSGEISSINDSVFTSHSEIYLPLGEYYITYTNNIGDVLGPVPCVVLDEITFSAEMPDAYLANGFSIQCGTRFMISDIEEHEKSLYVIADKKIQPSGSVQLELLEYSEKIYPEED